MDSNILDLTTTQPFHETEWIGKGKIFPDDPPQFILDARDELLRIPVSFQNYVPPNDTPIMHLLAWVLPKQTEAVVNVSAKEWFSLDKPCTMPQCLLTRDIPSRRCLEQLSKLLGQAWFDGAKSIVDPRYNNGRDRIPFWSITYWKQAIASQSVQTKWSCASSWLENRKKKTSQGDIETYGAYKTAEQRLTFVPWRMPLPYLRGTVPTTELIAYLGNDWLSDDNINMMVTQLSRDLAVAGKNDRTLIASLCVAEEIIMNGPHGTYPVKRPGHRGAPLLCRYEKCIKENKIEKLYFPANVGNHWIACCIDFEKYEISYGDSNRTHSRMTDELMAHTCTWLQTSFGFNAKIRGNSLPHAVQFDSFSCGVIAVNTIEHNTLGRALWIGKKADYHRVKWFNRLTAFLTAPQLANPAQKAQPVSSRLVDDPYLSVLMAVGDHNFPDLQEFVLESLEPIKGRKPRQLAESKTPVSQALVTSLASRDAQVTPLLPPTSPPPCSAPIIDSDNSPLNIRTSVSEIPVDSGSPGMVEPILVVAERPGDDMALDVHGVGEITPMNCSTDHAAAELAGEIRQGTKRKWAGLLKNLSDSEYDSDSENNESDGGSRTIGVPGRVQATKLSIPKAPEAPHKDIQTKRPRLEKESQIVNIEKLDAWKKELLRDDPHAWFDPLDPRRVRHSKCIKPFLVKHLYDKTRWNAHLISCEKKLRESNQKTKNLSQPLISSRMPSWVLTSKSATPHTSPQIPSHSPCPGLTEKDHLRIPVYLGRVFSRSAGGVAIKNLPGEEIDGKFANLPESEKERLRLAQTHTHRWRNEPRHGAVFSVSCLKYATNGDGSPCSECKGILKLHAFVNAISRDPPQSLSENLKFTNKVNRDTVIGNLFVEVMGLKELIEAEDGTENVLVRFALGVLSGKYDNKVLAGLVEAYVLKEDRLELGKGMQNFRWPLDYDEFTHLASIISPQFYCFFQKIFPAPSERTHRRREANQSSFPQEVGDEICDDTKLLSAYRPYLDGQTKKHYLVGGIDGPIEVIDPDDMEVLMDEMKDKKAVKVRLFCLTIPIRKVPPIIIAALPIPDNLKVDALFPLSFRILTGLLSRGINVISYACDGTETERKVQHQFVTVAPMHLEYLIASPLPGGMDINLKIPVIDGHPVAQIQDSRHALKTLRNNLFSGARLLVLGDFVAQYSHILDIAKDPNSPIYLRDVEKLDRQDDNAATRLFSAATLQYICDRHEGFKAEIPYLFVFGELVDAYQNRSILHIEHVQMVLRAHFFLDGWLKALELSSHVKKKHTLSREALDILRLVINGFLELIFIHRDHVGSSTPLLPWLHSSEVCEHVFGEARRIVKDFTLLDFIYMVPKLRVKIRQDVFQSRTSDPKARASGYSHTYFNYGDDNDATLARFPSDMEIAQAARVAADEADSLLAFLGLKPNLLRSLSQTPGIHAHLSPLITNEDHEEEVEDDGDTNLDGEPNEISELLELIRLEEGKVRLEKAEKEILNLTSASLALLVDDREKIQSMCQDEDIEKLATDEYAEVQAALNRFAANACDIPSPPIGQLPAHSPFSNVDFCGLVDTRRLHQTREAEKGIRTKGNNTDKDRPQTEESERQKTLKRIHEKLKMYNEDRGVGTGLERNARWKNGSKKSGNAANAAVVANANASKAAQKRRKIFTSHSVPEKERLITAGVTTIRKMVADGTDYVFCLANDTVVLGKVIGLQTKSATKNVRHQSTTSIDNISSASYIAIQAFEHAFGNRFTALTSRTTLVGTNQFEHLPPSQILCILSARPQVVSQRDIQLGNDDLKVFTNLRGGIAALKLAVAAFRKRGPKTDEDEE